MASGEIHYIYYKRDWVRAILLAIALVALAFAVQRFELLIVVASLLFHYYMARYIDPDLDQIGISSAEGRMLRELKLLGALMAGYWVLYAYLMGVLARITHTSLPKLGAHRSKVTHSLFPGTFIRILWFDLPLGIAIFVAWDIMHVIPGIDFYAIGLCFLGQYLGFGLADIRHYRLDKDKRYATKLSGIGNRAVYTRRPRVVGKNYRRSVRRDR